MQVKQLAFEQLMDIRAARVLVNSIADCYAALGVVHSLWQFIPGEFDDYIATPKDNLYRSIHTAVIGPGREPVEIQIRTHEMHADSERGVAAHWRYKEGGRGNQAYERKINELRSLLAPAEGAEGSRDFLDRVRVDLFQDRIYVISPKGEIVDVPVGGTPLDFAYQVHTDLGTSHARRQGQRAHGTARLSAEEQRNRGNHHCQNPAAVARLAFCPVGIPGEPAPSQQGAGVVSQAERGAKQGRGPRDAGARAAAAGRQEPAHGRTAARTGAGQRRVAA